MKTKIIFTAILLFTIVYAFSQPYIPFNKETKMWSEYWENSLNSNINGINTYILLGDTFFNSKNYKIYTYSYNEIYVFEDSVNKKVYLYDDFYYQDTLWYDFSLQLGDTIDVGSTQLIVTNKQLENFAGYNRSKLEFSFEIGFPTVLTWYEGIGSTKGVFQPFGATGASVDLLCYFENNTLLYHNSTINDSCFVTGIKELQSQNYFESFIFNEKLYITPQIPCIYNVSIFNLLGEKVLETINDKSIEINLSALPTGLYIYRISSNYDKLIISNKFLLTN